MPSGNQSHDSEASLANTSMGQRLSKKETVMQTFFSTNYQFPFNQGFGCNIDDFPVFYKALINYSQCILTIPSMTPRNNFDYMGAFSMYLIESELHEYRKVFCHTDDENLFTCFSAGFRGVSSGSEHASGGIQNDFEDAMTDGNLKGLPKGPYGSHTVRQVLSRNSNTPIRQMKQDSMDSDRSAKGMKGAVGLDDVMDGRKSDNFTSHIRYLNHLQRSADSGFASTEVEAQQARLKPLMRQTSVQENKEYELEMTEICSSKNSSKSELNYREISDESRKVVRDEIMFRDPIPEIKVQSNYSPKEHERTNMHTIADVPEDFRDQLTEVVTSIAQKHWEQQTKPKDTKNTERAIAGNELVQSIKKDLSTASNTYRNQPITSFPSPLAQLRQREGMPKGRVSKTGERISVDSFSDIPLPPLNMLAEKSGSQNSSPSPPLPTPPPEMLTDSEDPSFMFPSYGKGSRGDAGPEQTALGKTLPDIAETPHNSAVKMRKPQISRIPAINTSNSPVKHANIGNVQTNADHSIQNKPVKMNHPAVSKVPPSEIGSGQFLAKNNQVSQKEHWTQNFSKQ